MVCENSQIGSAVEQLVPARQFLRHQASLRFCPHPAKALVESSYT